MPEARSGLQEHAHANIHTKRKNDINMKDWPWMNQSTHSLIIKSAQDEESQCLSLYAVQIHTSKQLQGM